MARYTTTVLGRVIPIFKGEYNATSTYLRLECVTYQGNSYIAKQDVPSNFYPPSATNFWQQMAAKGDKGDPGTLNSVDASVNIVLEESQAGVSVDYENGNANFAFNLPRGPVGFNTVRASAIPTYSDGAFANASLEVISDSNTQLVLDFGIPQSTNTGISKINGQEAIPGTGGSFYFPAVLFTQGQSLTSTEQGHARANIGAQPLGNYLVTPQAVGTLSAPLVMTSDGCAWGSITSTTEIDAIVI